MRKTDCICDEIIGDLAMSEKMTDEFVTYELRGDIALVGLNRPQKRNAISDRFVEAIAAAAARAENEARAAVIFGHGDHFCAGLDLGEHIKKTPIEGVRGSAAGMPSSRRSSTARYHGFPPCMARSSAAGWNWPPRPICGLPTKVPSLHCPKGSAAFL